MADHATELDANESFEQSAAMFKAATGMLAPGKSEATGGQQTFTRYEVRYALWELWDKLKGWKGPQAIDAAVQGLVDAAEKAAKARDLDEIDGVLLDLDKALSIFRAGKPTLPAEVVEFPQATEEDRANGWSLNRKFLGEVKTRASEEVVSLDGIVSVEKITSLEQVECVLLAARAALLAKYTPKEQHDEPTD